MKIFIQGRLMRDEAGWRAEVPFLLLPVRAATPLRALTQLKSMIELEVNGEEIIFKIDEAGVFYLVTTKTPGMINFLATKLSELPQLDNFFQNFWVETML
jgi:hypothetical protein